MRGKRSGGEEEKEEEEDEDRNGMVMRMDQRMW